MSVESATATPSASPGEFHVVHIIPDPRYHGLQGYREVIETLVWGLNQLGYPTTSAANTFSPQRRTNIVIGGQMLSPEHFDTFPASTIFYNLEQIGRVEPAHLKASIRTIASRFKVWDYCRENLEGWLQIDPNCRPVLVPIGWYPGLSKIRKRSGEDIDVLLYGSADSSRFEIFKQICDASFRAMYVSGFYGPQRDDLIARSKIVLNLNRYVHARIFEIVRVSYLLANEKAVVSDIYPDSIIEEDLKDAVAFAPREKILETCARLLADDKARAELAARGRAAIEKRDIRGILQTALGSADASPLPQ
jgi:hypothetical protein